MTKAQTKNPDRRMRGNREEATESNIIRDGNVTELRACSKREDKKPRRDVRIAFRKRLLQVRMSGACYQVALCLCDIYADNGTGECFPSHASIAKHTDLSIRAVQDAISALKKKGFVATKRRGFSASLSYSLLIPYPADSRSEKSAPVSGNFSYLHPADSRSDGHENLPTNLTDELDCMNETEPKGVGASVPPSPFADAQFDPGHSAPDLTATANVGGEGQPSSDLREKMQEELLRAPSNPTDRITAIEAMLPDIAREDAIALAEWWALFPKTVQELEIKANRARAAHE